jgi:hypothetical protein
MTTTGVPPARAVGRGRAWYRGDCHVHSDLSTGGELTPARLAADARAAGLDFLATTEHHTAAGHTRWGPHAGDDLLVVLGQEVVTRTGHWLALGLRPGQSVDGRYGLRDGAVGAHLAAVRDAGGLCVAAHPHAPYPAGVFAYPYDGFDLVEVWNGAWTSGLPWQADNEAALAEWGRGLAAALHAGRPLRAVGGSDAHLAGQLGTPHTVVLADELSTAAVLTGLRAGRSWIAESAGVRLTLTAAAGARRAGIGDRLECAGRPVTVRVAVGGVPSGAVTFHTERGREHRAALPAGGEGAVVWGTTAEAAFVRVEVRHPGGRMAALTNPVLLA